MLPFPIHWNIIACLFFSFRTGRDAGLSQAETPYSTLTNEGYVSLSKQLTFYDTTTGFHAKWHSRKEDRNSILMTRHYPNPGSTSDWLKQFPKWHDQSEATNQKHHPDLVSEASSVWNFCTHFSDIIFEGKPVVASRNTACCLMLGVRNFSYY